MSSMEVFPPFSPEDVQRRFYGVDDAAVARIARDVISEEFSVVDGGVLDRFENAAAGFSAQPTPSQ